MQSSLPLIDYTQHPAYGGAFEPDEALRERALSVLRPLVETMRLKEDWKAAQFGYRYGHDGVEGEALARTGLHRVDLPTRLIDPICRAAAPVLARVKARLAQHRAAGTIPRFSDGMEVAEAGTHDELRASVDAMLKEVGVYDLATRFFNAKGAELRSAGVLVSEAPRDPDRRAQEPATYGFHIDSAGGCILKCVLYLDDVGPDQGPFGMAPGSHRWEAGSPGRVFRRAFDRSTLVSREAKERRLFVSLPPEMQVKAEFGGDMLPDQPEARSLVEQEAVSIGPRGMLSLFDPDAIHRGGLPLAAERRAMLISIRALWKEQAGSASA